MAEPVEKIRAFISLPAPPAWIEALGQLQRRLQAALPRDGVRWTPPEQLHLTLKFLGNVQASQLDSVQAALQQACAGTGRFHLLAEELGAFPTADRPRIIWVGLGGDVELLLALQKKIASSLETWSERGEDRAFRPHLTIGRTREDRQVLPELSRQIHSARPGSPPPPWQVTEVLLMRSQLSPHGAVHAAMGSVRLGDSAGRQ